MARPLRLPRYCWTPRPLVSMFVGLPCIPVNGQNEIMDYNPSGADLHLLGLPLFDQIIGQGFRGIHR